MTLKNNSEKNQSPYGFRVSDFERAVGESAFSIQILIISYSPKSLFVKEVTGFVESSGRCIRVSWGHSGKATVAGSPSPEFDLNL